MFEYLIFAFIAGGAFFSSIERKRWLEEVEGWSPTRRDQDCATVFSSEYYVPGSTYDMNKWLIGVTGLSGMGKSSLVNMLMEKEVAPVGQEETTQKAQIYEMDTLFLVDLPGNSYQFPMQNYTDLFGLKCFNILILMVERVAEFDQMILTNFKTYRKHYGQRLVVVYSKPLERTTVKSKSCSVWWEQCQAEENFISQFMSFLRQNNKKAECRDILDECQMRIERHVQHLSERLGHKVIALDTRYPDFPWQNSSIVQTLIQATV